MRGRDEFGSDIYTPPPQQHSSDDTSKKQFTECERPASYISFNTEKDQEAATGEVRESEKQMEEKETLNHLQKEGHVDVVVTEPRKKVKHVGESEDEEEKPHLYGQELNGKGTTLHGPVVVEDSRTGSSDEEEEELCDLVQRLHGALLSTPTGKCIA